MAAALPAKVTKTAIARMIGKSTGWIEICELKIDRPIWRASSAPAAKPAMPPMSASSKASAKKMAATVKLPAPERLHQSDFDAALVDGSRHRGGNGKRGSEQRGESDQQHQSLDARKHRTFILRDLADLLGMRMRDHFLQLVGDRLDIRRAIPAVINFRRHRLGIAGGERVRRLGQRADINPADGTGFSENLLGEGERRDDLVVFELTRWRGCLKLAAFGH